MSSQKIADSPQQETLSAELPSRRNFLIEAASPLLTASISALAISGCAYPSDSKRLENITVHSQGIMTFPVRKIEDVEHTLKLIHTNEGNEQIEAVCIYAETQPQQNIILVVKDISDAVESTGKLQTDSELKQVSGNILSYTGSNFPEELANWRAANSSRKISAIVARESGRRNENTFTVVLENSQE